MPAVFTRNPLERAPWRVGHCASHDRTIVAAKCRAGGPSKAGVEGVACDDAACDDAERPAPHEGSAPVNTRVPGGEEDPEGAPPERGILGTPKRSHPMSKHIEFKAGAVSCGGALAEPPGSAKVGAIVVVQEWHGINDEMRAKVDRFASEGFLALAPDLYHGKVATNDAEAGALMGALDFGRAVGEIGAAVEWLKGQPRSNGEVAVLGFCLGGALTIAAAANLPGLACTVPFYGVPDLSKLDLGKVTAPVLAHFAEIDDWASPAKARLIEADLKAKGKSIELHVYPGAGHAFMRDSDKTKYHEPSAKKAWARTIEFLKQHLA
jgi:carboxymethylenebutenolidase